MAHLQLLERDECMERLERALAESARGRIALLTGEAGIGKSSLLEAFLTWHQDDCRILQGSCEALYAPHPLGPLYDMAEELDPETARALQQGAGRPQLFGRLLSDLTAGPHPVVISLEDVHWADEATLDLIKYLGRRIDKVNALLLLTFRDDEVGPDHKLRFVLGDLPQSRVLRIVLPPLSASAVAELTRRYRPEAEATLGERVFRISGGNPFFVTELLATRQADDMVPPSVREAVLARIARISRDARSVLELASILPGHADLEVMSPIAGDDVVTALTECARTGVARFEGDTLSFRHELARRVVEDSIEAGRRRDLHRRVLAVLASEVPPRTSLLAHHAARAEDASAVGRWAPAAAAQAAHLGAHREAVTHHEAFLSLAAADLSVEERALALEAHAYECYLVGRTEVAVSSHERALAAWRERSRPEAEGRNLRWLSRLHWFLGHGEEAVRFGEEAIALLETLAPGRELAMAMSNRAQLHMLAGETAETVLWGERAIELARSLDAIDILVHALNNVGTARGQEGDVTGRDLLEESLRLSLAHELEEHAARAYTNLAAVAVTHRDPIAAEPMLREGITYATERDLDSWSLYMRAYGAWMNLHVGRWDDAAADAAAVLDRAPPAITRMPLLVVLATIRIRRGDPGWQEPLDEAERLALRSGEPQRLIPVSAARAEACFLRDDFAGVLAAIEPNPARFGATASPWDVGELSYWKWRADGSASPLPHSAPPFAAQIAGRWGEAASLWHERGLRYDEAWALADGDESDVITALEILHELGARAAADKIRRMARGRGFVAIPRGPRPTTVANPMGLTTRHLEVLGLLAEGLSNSEIAAQLFIAPKTVDHHVSAILERLGARSRAEAAAAAVRQGLIRHD